LNDVILRHGGEAKQPATSTRYHRRENKSRSRPPELARVVSPDDTASSLDPGDPTKTGFPQYGHGSIKLTVLFNDPTDPE